MVRCFKASLPVFVLALLALTTRPATATPGKHFDRAIIVIFENTNYSDALSQPFMGKLAKVGANFTNFMALVHPSQGNYIALTSASFDGVHGDSPVDLDRANIADLLEKNGLTWKVYAEDYPGNCFTGKSKGNYARKHNPFISYLDIQNNPSRCANIVEASEFDRDAQNGTLPNYIFFVPNIKNDGHDTGVAYADRWYSSRFQAYLAQPGFMDRTILISTFDESGLSPLNQIYTTIVGGPVQAANYKNAVNTYSLLSMLEDNWSLGRLGANDAGATPMPSIWK